MKTIRVIFAMIAIMLLFMTATALPQSQNVIHFQAQLADDNGDPVADAEYTVVFGLYTTLSGGTAVWEETQQVTTIGGVLSVKLGEGVGDDLDPDIFAPTDGSSPALYLDINFAGEVLSPRPLLGSVPTSFITNSVRGDFVSSPGEIVLENESAKGRTETSLGAIIFIQDQLPDDFIQDQLRALANGMSVTKYKEASPGEVEDEAELTAEGFSSRHDLGGDVEVRVDLVDGILMLQDQRQEVLKEQGIASCDEFTLTTFDTENPGTVENEASVTSTGTTLLAVDEYNYQDVLEQAADHESIQDQVGEFIQDQWDAFGDHMSYSTYNMKSKEKYVLSSFSSSGMELNEPTMDSAASILLKGLTYVDQSSGLDTNLHLGFDGHALVKSYEMRAGAQAGYVLTADADGVGTWQEAPGSGGGAGGWLDAGATVRLENLSDNVSLGTATAACRLDVDGTARVSNTEGGDWPSTGEGMEFGYDSDDDVCLIQVYDRDATSWGTLFLGYGDVGIGTQNPLGQLHVTAGGPYGNGLFISNGGKDIGYKTTEALQFGQLDVGTGAWTERMRLDGDGNLGVGHTDPAYRLDVIAEPTHYYAARFQAGRNGSGTHAVHAEYTGTESDGRGVYGKSTPLDYYGVGVEGEGGWVGVMGTVEPAGSMEYFGVKAEAQYGSGDNYGVYGESGGSSGNNYGVYGWVAVAGGNSYGVYGKAVNGTGNWAGYFEGNCRVTGTLANPKTQTVIDHPDDPENRYLCHASVSSPDMLNVYNGNVETDASGNAVVQLPDYFSSLNTDFRYQLTVIGQFAQAIVSEEIDGNQFSIRTDKPKVKVSWQVTGVRQDAFARANPMQVVSEKTGPEKGRYLTPDAFGFDASMGMGSNVSDVQAPPKERESGRP